MFDFILIVIYIVGVLAFGTHFIKEIYKRINNLKVRLKSTIPVRMSIHFIFRHKILFLIIVPILLYILTGFELAYKDSIRSPVRAAENPCFVGFLYVIVELFIQTSIILCLKNIAEGKKVRIVFNIIASVYYFLSYLFSTIKSFSIYLGGELTFNIGLIYYIFGYKKDGIYMKEALKLKKRLFEYQLREMMELSTIIVFSFLWTFLFVLFELWNVSTMSAIIAKYTIIFLMACGMMADIFGITYACQLFLWNKKWEETYHELLEQGITAPNIESVEIPMIH